MWFFLAPLLMAAALQRPTAHHLWRASRIKRAVLRPKPIVAQEGWITGVDEGGRAYYYREQRNAPEGFEFQYDPPAAVQHNYGGQVLCRVVGRAGIHYWCTYALKNGDVQALSRFAMLNQKVTVSRVQCIVQVHDHAATLTSCGRGPTLWRPRGHNWIALNKGEQAPLSDGDQVSLDCNDPEGAVFTCQDEGAMHQGYQQQGGYAQQQQQGGYGYGW